MNTADQLLDRLVDDLLIRGGDVQMVRVWKRGEAGGSLRLFLVASVVSGCLHRKRGELTVLAGT